MRTTKAIFLIVALLSVQYSEAGESQSVDVKVLEKKTKEFYNAGKYEEAITYAKEALKMNESKYGAKNIIVLQSRYNLADLYTQSENYTEAESQLTKIRDTLIDMSGTDVSNAWSLFQIYLDLADLYGKMGKAQAGAEMYAFSLKALRVGMKLSQAAGKIVKSYGSGTDDSSSTDPVTLGDVIADSIDNAIPEPEDIIMDAIDNWLEWGESTLTKWSRIQYIYTGNFSRTMKVYQKILDRDIMTYGKNSAAVASDLSDQAIFYMAAKRYADAEVFFKRALEIYEKASGKDHSNVASVLQNLSDLFKATGRHSEAEQLLKRVLEIKGNITLQEQKIP